MEKYGEVPLPKVYVNESVILITVLLISANLKYKSI